MIFVAPKHDACASDRFGSDRLACECTRSQENKVGFLQMQTPECECALLECLRVWGDACIRIRFRGGKRQDLRVGTFFRCERTVPKAQIAFPRFEVPSCLRDDGERLTRITL